MSIQTSTYEHQLKGCIPMAKLIAMYFRGYSRASAAKKKFITAIEEDEELYAELKKVGFSFDNEFVIPKQTKLIINRWGYPDHVMINCKNKIHPAGDGKD